METTTMMKEIQTFSANLPYLQKDKTTVLFKLVCETDHTTSTGRGEPIKYKIMSQELTKERG